MDPAECRQGSEDVVLEAQYARGNSCGWSCGSGSGDVVVFWSAATAGWERCGEGARDDWGCRGGDGGNNVSAGTYIVV